MSQEGGGGGHGGKWIVTYADMITLLMAGFIVIVTFASRETDKMAPRSDSVIGTQSGSGVAGQLRKGPEKNHVVVRRPPMAGNAYDKGSEMPPLYSDIPIEVAKSVEASLDAAKVGKLSDNYQIAYPFAQIFDGGDALSEAGTLRMRQVFNQIRSLPYEVVIQVRDLSNLAKAMRVYVFLFETCGLTPLRLGVAVNSAIHHDGLLVLAFRHPAR